MKTKQILICAVFALVLVGLSAWLLFKPAETVSSAERRTLAQFMPYDDWRPAAGTEKTLANYFSYLETVCLDQFPERQRFRELRAFAKTGVFFQRDAGGYYLANGSIGKIDTELSESALTDALETITKLDRDLFSAARRYYAVVPDKGYYLTQANGYPAIDYDRLFSMVDGALGETAEKIDLTGLLHAEDYYRTDPHWKQEDILSVADAILAAMDASPLASQTRWSEQRFTPFYGASIGHAALHAKQDEIVCLSAENFSGVTVYNYETGKTESVYDAENFKNVDPYDVYLGGARAMLRIDHPAQTNGRRLIVLRDSFGSSLAPLLIPAYSEITLVDIRYVSPRQLPMLLSADSETDVLYLYSTGVLNSFGAFMR